MSIEGVHIRDALEPLAGDPVQDAARVLADLPNKSGIPPIAYWLLGAGLAVGLSVGAWFSFDSPSEPDPIPVRKNEDVPKEDEKRKEEERREKDRQEKDSKDEYWDHITLYAFGQVEVTEPGEEPVKLERGYKVEMKSSFRTLEGRAGMLFADQSQLRADLATDFSVPAVDQIKLDKGQIWAYTGEESQGTIDVQTPVGFVYVQRGSSNVEYRSGRLQVVCLIGDVEIQPTAGAAPIQLVAGQMAWCTELEAGEPTDAGFVERHTSWMTNLLLRQQDDTELVERIEKMIKLYFEGEFRAEASRELTRLGAAAVPRMIRVFREQTDMDPQFKRKTAEKICNAAESTTVYYLFYLLDNADPDVRVIGYRHIRRITDDDFGKDESFWRDATVTAEERGKVTRAWSETVK